MNKAKNQYKCNHRGSILEAYSTLFNLWLKKERNRFRQPQNRAVQSGVPVSVYMLNKAKDNKEGKNNQVFLTMQKFGECRTSTETRVVFAGSSQTVVIQTSELLKRKKVPSRGEPLELS